ncbi:16S rRNA (guanine(527)-N(7))-methyltransferase RsmG [Lachnospiraceae bacterium HCP1S3_C3]|nr:16S rRNA (guanine(527)-N(7))-methyltransferase RsmG [Lachnospiraceae bacterium]MDD6856964.1 16S rRNA (guanine(527)-N(7))-methyltransferase RsmG [Lachnospiraceae bacterium]
MDKNVDNLKNKLNQLSIEYSESQIEKLLKYYEMLIEKNKVMNLTAITEFDEVVEKHFIDSLSIVRVIDMEIVHSIIDIGTGAGFPGIPVKIMFPHVKVTLVDSLNKRVNFLNEVIENLELSDIEAYHGRAEDYGRDKKFREKYDVCVSRAVANLASLSEYCMPFVKPDGYFISYKAGDCEKEIDNSKNAIKILSGKIEKVEKFSLPDSEISRSFIKIKKIKNLSNKYPRKSGIPSRNPL